MKIIYFLFERKKIPQKHESVPKKITITSSGRIAPIALKITIVHECFELSTTSHFGQKI